MPDVIYTFPKGDISIEGGKAKIKYNRDYVNKFNQNGRKVQMFLDKLVANNLQQYVSYKTGTQEKSIVLSSNYGSGYVTIGVPYASYQAYSKRIRKRVGKRGTQPFERMKADKKSTILKQVADYSKEINK